MSLDTEEAWRPAVGHVGYEVSSHGRVKSYRRNPRGRLLTVNTATQGYAIVKLPRRACDKPGPHQRNRYVHQMVLEAFVGPMPDGLVTRHLDDVRTNNHLSNLRWGTVAENVADLVRSGNSAGERAGTAKLTNAAVLTIRREAAAGDCHTPPALARLYGVSNSAINRVINGKTWTHLPLDGVALS